MISKSAAIDVLSKSDYERHSIAPSISGYERGISLNVYFTNAVSNHYAYGDGMAVSGYIAPARYLKSKRSICEMIGYSGDIVIIDSEGRTV